MLHAEALQVLHLKVLEQLLAGGGFGKHPVVQLEGKELVAEVALEHGALAALEEYLLGTEVVQQLVHVVEGAFGCKELTGRYIEESHTTRAFAKVHGRQEVVLAVVQHVVVDADTRRHKLGNATLHQLLGQLGVFQLVTDGHALAGSDKLRQISVEGMMGKAGHFNGLSGLAVISLGQRDTQYFGSHNGISGVGFVEVATTEQHHGVRVLGLEVEKLFHHGGKDYIFVLHCACSVKVLYMGGKDSESRRQKKNLFEFYADTHLILFKTPFLSPVQYKTGYFFDMNKANGANNKVFIRSIRLVSD